MNEQMTAVQKAFKDYMKNSTQENFKEAFQAAFTKHYPALLAGLRQTLIDFLKDSSRKSLQENFAKAIGAIKEVSNFAAGADDKSVFLPALIEYCLTDYPLEELSFKNLGELTSSVEEKTSKILSIDENNPHWEKEANLFHLRDGLKSLYETADRLSPLSENIRQIKDKLMGAGFGVEDQITEVRKALKDCKNIKLPKGLFIDMRIDVERFFANRLFTDEKETLRLINKYQKFCTQIKEVLPDTTFDLVKDLRQTREFYLQESVEKTLQEIKKLNSIKENVQDYAYKNASAADKISQSFIEDVENKANNLVKRSKKGDKQYKQLLIKTLEKDLENAPPQLVNSTRWERRKDAFLRAARDFVSWVFGFEKAPEATQEMKEIPQQKEVQQIAPMSVTESVHITASPNKIPISVPAG